VKNLFSIYIFIFLFSSCSLLKSDLENCADANTLDINSKWYPYDAEQEKIYAKSIAENRCVEASEKSEWYGSDLQWYIDNVNSISDLSMCVTGFSGHKEVAEEWVDKFWGGDHWLRYQIFTVHFDVKKTNLKTKLSNDNYETEFKKCEIDKMASPETFKAKWK